MKRDTLSTRVSSYSQISRLVEYVEILVMAVRVIER